MFGSGLSTHELTMSTSLPIIVDTVNLQVFFLIHRLSEVTPMNPKTPATPSDCARRYGPWAVLTGAAEGIGHALAIESARRRLHLALAARLEPVLQQLAVICAATTASMAVGSPSTWPTPTPCACLKQARASSTSACRCRGRMRQPRARRHAAAPDRPRD
jgi:hypothetical protein